MTRSVTDDVPASTALRELPKLRDAAKELASCGFFNDAWAKHFADVARLADSLLDDTGASNGDSA